MKRLEKGKDGERERARPTWMIRFMAKVFRCARSLNGETSSGPGKGMTDQDFFGDFGLT